MSSCEENLNDWQKLLVEKNYLQWVFFEAKQHPNLACMRQQQFWFQTPDENTTVEEL